MFPVSSPAPAEIIAAVNAAAARLASFRFDVRWYATVTSTMDIAEQAVLAGAPEGVVIVAEEQTQGRGRRGRSWSSPAGAGLYLTFVFRPALNGGRSPALPLMTLGVGVAVRNAIAAAAGFSPELKWPNDLMVQGRKLAGILAEGIAVGTVEQTVLVGIGTNVLAAAHPEEIAGRATSLQHELGRVVDRGLLLQELLVAVPRVYQQLGTGGAGDILHAWRNASPSAVGREVQWEDAEGLHRGITAGIEDEGALLVRTPDGTRRIIAGELTWM
jgi:BirA family biotin operon repressor/biotin-[acetyl-CoA-carboxylase] ligase